MAFLLSHIRLSIKITMVVLIILVLVELSGVSLWELGEKTFSLFLVGKPATIKQKEEDYTLIMIGMGNALTLVSALMVLMISL